MLIRQSLRGCARQFAPILALSLLTLLVFATPSRSDIIFQNQKSGRLVNWLMAATSMTSFSFLTDPGSVDWKMVGSADFDGDGKPDLLFQNQQSGQLVYWLMDGTTLRNWGYINPSLPGPIDWKVVAVADLTGDQNPDILFQNQTTGQLVYWAMRGTNLVNIGSFPDPGSPDWKVAGAGDFDGDGHPDLLFQNQKSGLLVYWLMKGASIGTIGFLPDPGSSNWKVVGLADFNADGKQDLLFQNQQTGQLVYWLMNGTNLATIGFIAPSDPGSLDWKVAAVWAPQSHGPAPVNLKTAANYVILSKSGVSNVPNSAITGNIGVSPIASSAITGFSLLLDPGGAFSTSSQVTGKIFAADYAVPTPSNLTTAIGDMQIAYTDAAGRTTPDYTELASGNIGGLTLPAGLYKWSNTVTIPANVTLNGGPNDVWIFQIAGGVTQSSSTKVILSGGAQAKNIFWQVAGAVDVGTGAHMEGEILSQTAISMKTGATANGRMLAQTAVTLQSNTIVQK